MKYVLRRLSIFFTILLAFLIQVSLGSYIQLGMATPNLLLIVVVIFTIVYGIDDGLIAGIIAGILMDLLFSDYLAFYVLLYASIAYLSSVIDKFYFGSLKRIIYFLVFMFSIVYGMVMYIIFYLLRGRYFVFTYLFENILPSTIYTTLAAIVLGPAIIFATKKYLKWVEKKEDYFA